jgi:putative phage-type endonuclease
MNALLKMVQGSTDWHEHRAQYFNASETPVVMGASPWQTPHELWLVKTGRKVIEVTAPMQHGTNLEPAARAAFEEATSIIMQPQVVVDGDYSASLDGITLNGQSLLEIKCPYKGQTSELWQMVKSGSIPEHYRLQVQHQLMVSKAKLAYLWIYDGSNGIKITIEPDEATFVAIRTAWEAFRGYLDADTPPPLTDQDTKQRNDAAWQQAAEAYRSCKAAVDDAQAKADEAKATLLALATHTREAGFGVSVTRFWKQGNVDYKKVPELQGVSLDLYRGKSREEVRVTIG